MNYPSRRSSRNFLFCSSPRLSAAGFRRCGRPVRARHRVRRAVAPGGMGPEQRAWGVPSVRAGVCADAGRAGVPLGCIKPLA